MADDVLDNLSLQGSWTAIAEQLRVGDVVRAAASFHTIDSSLCIRIPLGMAGVIQKVDDDGDACILFPALEEVQAVDRWVYKASFSKLEVFRTVTHEDSESGSSDSGTAETTGCDDSSVSLVAIGEENP